MHEVVVFYLPKHKRKVWYQEEYLHSEHWKRFRAWLLSRYPQCIWCWHNGRDTRRDLNICHLTYAHLWFEQEDDVVVLCHTHHFQMDDGKLDHALVIKMRDEYKKKRVPHLLRTTTSPLATLLR